MTRNTFYGIQFTRSGWKQFCKANHSLAGGALPGIRFIRAFVLKNELSAYLKAHEVAGIHMDTDCQEIRYDDGIYLLLCKMQGEWYITDVILSPSPTTFLPVYTVRSILRGFRSVIALIFSGWQHQVGKTEKKAVII